jgi:hypothetical protein
MKKIFLLLLIAAGLAAKAQVVIPEEVAQRLQNDKSFSSYAKEMMRYVKDGQTRFTDGSREKTYYTKQEKFLARQLWYLEGRQEANGDIANYSRKTFTAFNSYENVRAQQRIEATAYGSWSVVGPTNMTTSATSLHTGIGRVDRIAFHPTDPNIIFAGTPAGGIFKSFTGGNSWINLNSFMPSLGVSGIVVSWADPNDIYVLTGDGDSNLGDGGFVQGFDYIRPSVGVLKSTDGGATWQQTADFGIAGFFTGFKLVQDPANANVLIAATSQGLYRTTSGGNNWTLVSPNTNTYFDLEWRPNSASRVYAATSNTFYMSTDGGATFVNSNANFDVAIGSCSRIAIAVTPVNSSYVYVFAGQNLGSGVYANKGVYRSTDAGNNFTQRTTNNSLVSGLPNYMHNIAVASDNVNIVLTGSLDIWRSTNGASNFALANQRGDATQPDYAHDDVHEVIYNPLDNALYIGCDGGVYKSTDDGVSYTAKYVGLNATQYYHFDVSTLDENYMFGGAQDNGGHYRSGATTTFQNTIKGDGYDARFYNGVNDRVYLSVNKSIYRSNSGLTGWTEILGLVDDWYKTIAMSYSSSNIVFTSSDPVYRTINGSTWTNIGANGRWAMITCPSNSNRVYAAGGDSWNDGGTQTGKKLFRSSDQGDTWTELQENPGFPETITKITSIGVDPANSLRIWVTMGGFTDGQKVYYSTNGGDSWQNISGSIPNIPVNCVAIDDNLDAYIGTDVGVFFKSIGTTDWQPFYNSMPRVPVTQMHIRTGTIYASTFGRGIWKSDTHGGCPASLSLAGNISGIRFYEALDITSTNTLTSGLGTEIQLRAQNSVTLDVGFKADASTGAKFRAWIANCNSGGIPVFRNGEINTWLQSQRTADANKDITATNTEDGMVINVEMPFDGKAGIVLLNEKDEVKEVLLQGKMLLKGKSQIKLNNDQIDWTKRTIVLMADGQILGVIRK